MNGKKCQKRMVLPSRYVSSARHLRGQTLPSVHAMFSGEDAACETGTMERWNDGTENISRESMPNSADKKPPTG